MVTGERGKDQRKERRKEGIIIMYAVDWGGLRGVQVKCGPVVRMGSIVLMTWLEQPVRW